MSLLSRLRSAPLFQLLAPAAAPPADFPFVPSDVALYHRSVRADGADVLDAQTWDEMLLAPYSAELAGATSIFGQQELHRRLHTAAGEDGAPAMGAASVDRVRALAADAPRLQRLHQACQSLRRADCEVGAPLFASTITAAPRWAARLYWVPLGFALSFGLGLGAGLWPCWAAAGAFWLALMAIQMKHHEEVERWERILKSLQMLLRTHSLLAALDDPLAGDFAAGQARAGKLNRAISRSPLNAAMPVGREYADWLCLSNVRHHFASRDLVRLHGDFLRESFVLVARLEADIALARHLARTPHHCWAERGGQLTLEQAVHPLLAGAAPLTVALEGRGAFISGQNGSGKSTLLRTVGLNLIAARAFGFCYAGRAVTPALPVYSSMQGEDTLAGGESLYIAELRRARELLALADAAPALFIVDEIFRGTNYLESISAAAAVLHSLAAAGRVLVSSHNLVLAALLADRLAPWCVSAPGGDHAQLRLTPGVLAETNGIALLGQRGFDAAISAKAQTVFDWLSDYMARPGDCAGLMAPRSLAQAN